MRVWLVQWQFVSKELATGGLGANIGRVQVHTKQLARTPDDSDWDGLPAANDFVPAVVNGRQMADGQVLTYDYFGHTWRPYRICYRPKDRNCEPVDLAINCFVSTSLLARFNGNTRSDRPCRADCVVENPVSWSDGRMIFLCDFCRFQLYTTPENEGCFFLLKKGPF